MQISRNASNAVVGIALLASTVSIGACASLNHRGGGEAQAQQTALQVTNDSWSDMTVYAIVGGSPWRIGFVSGHTTATFKLSQGLVTDTRGLQLLARPIAGRAYLIPAVQVSPGEVVSVTLANDPAFSHVAVWPR